MDLTIISDSELIVKLGELTGKEREVTIQVLHYLNEVERRQTYRDVGYSSLYVFCQKKLKYSEGSTYRRIAAARALITNPELEGLILSGEVTLCAIATAAESLKSNEIQVTAICNKTKREVAALVQKTEVHAKPKEVILPLTVSPLKAPLLPEVPAEERVSVKFSLSKADYALFEEVRAKLSNALGTNLTIEAVFTKLISKFLTKPKCRRSVNKSSRYISRSIRHEVYTRDKGTCSFVAPDGTRCQAKTHLQYDHIIPFAADGTSEASNLRLLCSTHNQLEAERFFGKDFISKKLCAFPGKGDSDFR